MWTKNHDGSVSWSEDAKITLVRLLGKNVAAISNERLNPQKPAAWENVYEALIEAGMPKTSITRVKKCWSRIFLAAKFQMDLSKSQLKEKSSKPKLSPLSKLDVAVINLLNMVNSYDDAKNDMPKPKIEVKKEPTDAFVEETIHSKRIRLTERKDMNPIVRLNRIKLADNHLMTPIEENRMNDQDQYYSIKKKVAENDWKLKLMQREHEEERMENEREIHRKTLILMDLKIEVQHLQIEALRGQNLYK